MPCGKVGFRKPPALSRALAAFALVVTGCAGGTPLERAGVARLDVPEGWAPVPETTWPVPGQPVKAWKGPGGSSFVVYREPNAPQVDARSFATRTANRYQNLPGLTVLSARVGGRFGGVPAAEVEAVAPGTGATFLPTGTGVPLGPRGQTPVATRRVLVAFPGKTETLTFLWHAAESDARALDVQIARFQFRPAVPR